jgi:hypothetical protein
VAAVLDERIMIVTLLHACDRIAEGRAMGQNIELLPDDVPLCARVLVVGGSDR